MQTVLKNTDKNYYKTIVVGAGAAGLYFGAGVPCGHGRDVLVLEKTARPAMKLLMAGSGQCNVTHGGSIKDFLDCYGDHGSRIRTCLYKHNNLELMSFLENLGVPLTEREDGKVFPASMDAHDVKNALTDACVSNGVEIRLNSSVAQIRALEEGFEVVIGDASINAGISSDINAGINAGMSNIVEAPSSSVMSNIVKTYTCTNLVIAAGGCSYPATGSDGSIFRTLLESLNIEITEPRPALVPVFLQDYPFGELSGISLKNVGLKVLPQTKIDKQESNAKTKKAKPLTFTGDLLFTHRNLSGPVIINNSRYIQTGSRLQLNFVQPETADAVSARLKQDAPGSSRLLSSFIAEEFGLPKRFVSKIVELAGLEDKKLSALSGKEISALARSLAAAEFSVSGLGGFNVAMVTCGGVNLDQVSLKTMESKHYPGLYFIGEVLDIDGDTGGYNLQFAYSSANAALDNIFSRH